MNRPDDILLDHIWRSLWNEETIHAIDIQDISVVVENGQVCLSGHVTKDTINQRIAEIIRPIPGVIAVHNHLVADNNLSSQVALVLGENEALVHLRCPFPANMAGLNWETLYEPRNTAYRGRNGCQRCGCSWCILLPNIKGENPSLRRDAVQPRISVRVYGDDENEETVYQVLSIRKTAWSHMPLCGLTNSLMAGRRFAIIFAGRGHASGGCLRYLLDSSRTDKRSVPRFDLRELSLRSAYLAAPLPICGWQCSLAPPGKGKGRTMKHLWSSLRFRLFLLAFLAFFPGFLLTMYWIITGSIMKF